MASISDDDIAIIRSTWARIAPVGKMASQLFYGRLFRIAPDTRPLFSADMAAQGRKLVATLGFIIDHLDQSAELTDAARDLARRHVDYGVTAEQYAQVGEALIWMLRELLGSVFGEREEAAWTRLYTSLSRDMIEVAYGSTA